MDSNLVNFELKKQLKSDILAAENMKCITSEERQDIKSFLDQPRKKIKLGEKPSGNGLSQNSTLVNIACAPSILKTLPSAYSKTSKAYTAKVPVKRFKCYVCSKTFPSYSEVVMHQKLLHNACASRDCSKLTDFKMHSSVCANRGLGCAICSKKFSDKILLLAHFNDHIGAAFYACEICREGFQQRKDLQRHLYHSHGKNASFPVITAQYKTVYQKCGRCSKYFKLFAEFGEHMSLCNSSTYACCVCQIIFSSLSALDEHRLAEHKHEHASKGHAALKQGKRYFCGVCYLGFFKGDILRKHLMTHNMEMTYVCDVCCENFLSDNDLQSHYLQHIEEHYILYDLISQHYCQSCMKTFKTQKELKDHLIVSNCKNINSKKGSLALSLGELKEPDGRHKGQENDNNNNTQDDVDTLDTSEIPIYALKSGEELINCDDSKCIIIMDLTSLFVLQRGICASENRMPDVINSEAYNETDVIDASLLQNHMFQILNANNDDNLFVSEKPSDLHSNIESSHLEQNSNVDSASVEIATIKFDESNDDSLKFIAHESNESLSVGKVSVNSDNANDAFEFLQSNTSNEPFSEDSSIADLITEAKVPCVNEHAVSETINEENLMECYDESSISDLYICDICKQVFSTKLSLNLHVKGTHTDFDCHQCGVSFNSHNELKKHKESVHESSFQCEFCELSYPKEDLLKKHKCRAHAVKEFNCYICKMKFLLKNEYEAHMQKHRAEKPPLKCKICGKVYIDVVSYTRHKATHETLSKKYVCSICDKTFIDSLLLKMHLKSHIGKSNYECPKCKMCFPQEVLDKHIKSHDDMAF